MLRTMNPEDKWAFENEAVLIFIIFLCDGKINLRIVFVAGFLSLSLLWIYFVFKSIHILNKDEVRPIFMTVL
jgi:hypothetical protein